MFSPIITKLGQNVCLDEISGKFENGSCQLKKLGQVLEEPCVRSRGHIFCPIIMNVCLDEIWSSKMGHVVPKLGLLGQILEKNLVYAIETYFYFRYSLKLVRMFALISMKMGHVWSETRSLCKILESQCRRLRLATSGPSWPSCWCFDGYLIQMM